MSDFDIKEICDKSLSALEEFYCEFERLSKLSFINSKPLSKMDIRGIEEFRKERGLYKSFLSQHIKYIGEFAQANKDGVLEIFRFYKWSDKLDAAKLVFAYVCSEFEEIIKINKSWLETEGEKAFELENESIDSWYIPFSKQSFANFTFGEQEISVECGSEI